jgi:pimeloyl-ACP methyl ester carboxylesterase
MRGYNLSDRRRQRHAYHLRHLVADVVALVHATGYPRAHIAGHDWGGIIAWTFAGEHPELLDKLVILNAPHPRSACSESMTRATGCGLRRLMRSTACSRNSSAVEGSERGEERLQSPL